MSHQSTKILVTLLLLFGLVLPRMPMPRVSGASSRDRFEQGQIIIALSPGGSIGAFNDRHGTSVIERIEGADQYLLSLPPNSDVEAELDNIAGEEGVLFAGPNYRFQSAEIRQHSQAYIDQHSQAYIDNSSPAMFFGQPTVSQLHLETSHRYSHGTGVRVAVIDTGIDYSHPLFSGRIGSPAYDFVGNDTNAQEEGSGEPGYGHGTFVAGLIALVAPGAVIIPLRTFGPDGSGTTFNIAKAIRYATDQEAQVINLSFGLLVEDSLIKDALDYAYSRAYMVAAAGNDDLEMVHFPASRDSKTLSVTSVDAVDHKSSFANFHAKVHVSAPGSDIYSAFPGGRWATWSGTSFSTAIVSGEAALLLQMDETLNRTGLNTIITTAGADINSLNPTFADKLGRVRVDPLAAVQTLGTGMRVPDRPQSAPRARRNLR